MFFFIIFYPNVPFLLHVTDRKVAGYIIQRLLYSLFRLIIRFKDISIFKVFFISINHIAYSILLVLLQRTNPLLLVIILWLIVISHPLANQTAALKRINKSIRFFVTTGKEIHGALTETVWPDGTVSKFLIGLEVIDDMSP